MRVDKYLWTIRAYKTRSLAAKMVERGEVKINDKVVAKASAIVRLGDVLDFPNPTLKFQRRIEVLGFAEQRLGAPQARELYAETDPPPEDPFYWDGEE